jgi:hypothetical protein
VTPELMTAMLGVGGLAAIIPLLIDGLKAWRSGRAQSEKTKNRSILERLADAETRAENEADFRRALEDYAGVLRVMLVQAGIALHRLPGWPVRKAAQGAVPQHNRRSTDSGPTTI